VAGLPDLMMEDRKMPLTSLILKEMLQEDLHVQDYQLASFFFLPFDHQNILSKLYNQNKPFDKRAVYDEALIEEVTDKKAFELYEGGELLPYLNDFLTDYFEQEEKPDRVDAERNLLAAYYNMLLSQKNPFLRQFATYELDVRNLFVALNGRKHGIAVDQELMGTGNIVEALRKSRARDFGLSADFDNLDAFIQIHENPDILDRELKLDILRWQFLDEASFFNYFSIEKVLAFTLKLMIAERWFELDEEKGRDLFKQLLNDLESGYEFPEEFKLSHGKKK
jgi:hypothetical protein